MKAPTKTTQPASTMNVSGWLSDLRAMQAARDVRAARFAQLNRMAATPATFRTPALLSAFFRGLNS